MRKMRISRIVRTVFLAAVLTAAVVFPAAAGEADHSAETENASVIPIGEKASDADYEVTLVNESGKEITGVALRVSYEEFSDNLLPEDTVLKDQGKGTLWCTPGEIVNYVPPVYDIMLTFADDSTAVLHTLPFGDADEITILTEKEEAEEGEEKASETEAEKETETVYARFFSFSMNNVTDSLQREKNIRESGEAVLVADYKAKVERSSGSGSGGGGSSGGGGGGSAPAPTQQQQCLDNGLVF